jgi:hypothetical protein
MSGPVISASIALVQQLNLRVSFLASFFPAGPDRLTQNFGLLNGMGSPHARAVIVHSMNGSFHYLFSTMHFE